MFVGILIFFFILFSLVIIHEFGHYYAAKKSGVRVEEFGFGLPPRLFGHKFGKAPEKGEDDRTLFSLNLLPIGGFVRMTGEDATLADSDPKNFQNAKLWKRMWIVLSGVAMNFVLGILLFSIVYTHIGIPSNPARFDVTISEVSVDSPAATAGLVAGDKIVGINDTVVTSADVLTKEITENFDKTVSLKIERNGEQKTYEVFARAKENRPENQGALGVGLGEKLVTTRAEWYKMPFLGAVQGLKDTFALAKSIVPALGDLVSTLVLKQQVPAGVSGPAGIAKASFMFCNEFYSCLQFAGLLSVNLAVFNLLPLPALDGGRFFFMLVEAVTRKKVNPKFEQWVHSIGMILLLILILIVTYNDIFTKNPLIK